MTFVYYLWIRLKRSCGVKSKQESGPRLQCLEVIVAPATKRMLINSKSGSRADGVAAWQPGAWMIIRRTMVHVWPNLEIMEQQYTNGENPG